MTNQETSEEQVLSYYRDIICSYDDPQKAQWSRWIGRLPKRVANISNEHLRSVQKVEQLQTLTYVFSVISAAIPIIVAILAEIQQWSRLASLVDAVFPAIVAVTYTNLTNWQKKTRTYASVYSPYHRLLADIILSIYEKTYQKNSRIYEDKFEELDKILQNAGVSG
jgi:hypothetical protein